MKAILFVLLIAVLYFAKAQPVSGFDQPGATALESPADPNAGNQAPNLIGQVAGGPDSVIAKPPPGGDFIIQYHGQGQPKTFKYDECVPFKQGENTVNFAKFNELVVCYVYQDDACGFRQHNVPIPLVPKINVENPLNVGSTLAGSYKCYNYAEALRRILDPNSQPQGGSAGPLKGA